MAENTTNPLIEADPRLKELRAKIEALLDEYQAAGSFQLASSTHAEFAIVFPKWSAIQFEDEGEDQTGLHVRSSSERDGRDHLGSSVHLLLAMRDTTAHQAAFLIHASNVLLKALEEAGVEVEHTPLQEVIDREMGQ